MTEIASDIMQLQPVSLEEQRLLHAHNVDDQMIHRRTMGHVALINAKADQIAMAIQITSELTPHIDALLPIANAFMSAKEAPEKSGFVVWYERVARSPIRKMEVDNTKVRELLSVLGPTNELRDTDGRDAAFDLATMRKLLLDDYDRLEVRDKNPDLLMDAAYLTEMIALLWRPKQLNTVLQNQALDNNLTGTTRDPNLFSDRAMSALSDEQRWTIVGSELFAHAAATYKGIFESRKGSPRVRQEAFTRMVDMGIRQLQLVAPFARTKEELDAYGLKIEQLAGQHLKALVDAVKNPKKYPQLKPDIVFEQLAVAVVRQETMEQYGPFSKYVRLALPSEDRISKNIENFRDTKGTIINVSSDVIVGSSNTTHERRLQVKNDTLRGWHAIGGLNKLGKPMKYAMPLFLRNHAEKVLRDIPVS